MLGRQRLLKHLHSTFAETRFPNLNGHRVAKNKAPPQLVHRSKEADK